MMEKELDWFEKHKILQDRKHKHILSEIKAMKEANIRCFERGHIR